VQSQSRSRNIKINGQKVVQKTPIDRIRKFSLLDVPLKREYRLC
jgi:hypothetical protein